MAAGDLAAPMARLVDELKRLPGVGAKSAQRLAFHLLGVDREKAESLLCPICSDPRRDQELVCVLEQPNNIMVLERTRAYTGVYHILHGALSPLRSVGPEDLKIKNLIERMRDNPIREIILATSPTTEGQATSAYLSRLLKPLDVKVSRIGLGIPIGTELEFIDEATMIESIEGRREL